MKRANISINPRTSSTGLPPNIMGSKKKFSMYFYSIIDNNAFTFAF